ncbi:hypothetical protein [Croceicoccus ponticola]|nr:hypothetical protein [Croceicoccus ponticola]
MSSQLTRSAAASFAVLLAVALWAPTIAPVSDAQVAAIAQPALA